MGSQKKKKRSFRKRVQWDWDLSNAYYSWLNDGGFAWAEEESQKWEDFIRSEEDFEDHYVGGPLRGGHNASQSLDASGRMSSVYR